jgi:dihydropteroate synthase
VNPRPHFALEIAGRKVRLGERTLVMGVVNVTPDSFSDGGRYLDSRRAVEHGLELARQGADWIDVGGESTRPGSKPVPAEEELRRVLPVIQALSKKLRGVPISIDTTKAEVAEFAVRAGAAIVNDVSGLRFDARLAEVARRHSTPLILMHIRGKPATMQHKPFASSIWRSVREGLAWSIRRARAAGLRRSQLIVDPGLGFGKSRRQNFEILAQLGRLREFRLPILVGTSRKSFVRAIAAAEGPEPSELATFRAARAGLGDPWPAPPGARRRERKAADLEDRFALRLLESGDAAAVVASILAGAHIVRVHDVAAVLPAVRIADAVLKAASR